VLGIRENDLVYSAAKLFFAYGLGNGMTFPMAVGATAVLMAERPTPQAVFKRLREHKPTSSTACRRSTPALLASPEMPKRASCAAARVHLGRRGAAGGHRQALDGNPRRRDPRRHRLHRDAAHLPFQPRRRGALRHHRQGGARLRGAPDRRGRHVVAPGEIGELQIKGPSAAALYWNQREKSRHTFMGDWTRSGDKYTEIEDGYYQYCGRSDDMLKVSGIYVSPFEVEAALMTHPRRCSKPRWWRTPTPTS
jgi:benzoate-CoA ligase